MSTTGKMLSGRDLTAAYIQKRHGKIEVARLPFEPTAARLLLPSGRAYSLSCGEYSFEE